MYMKSKDELILEMKQIFNQTIVWINAQTDSNLNHRHLTGKWTAAQHVYHLIKSTKGVSYAMNLPKIKLRNMFGDLEREQHHYEELVDLYSKLVIH